jgi:hypothetical protein
MDGEPRDFMERLLTSSPEELREWLEGEALRRHWEQTAPGYVPRVGGRPHESRAPSFGTDGWVDGPEVHARARRFEERLRERSTKILLEELAFGWLDYLALRDKPPSVPMQALVIQLYARVWPELTSADLAHKLASIGVDKAFVERVLADRYCLICGEHVCGEKKTCRSNRKTCSPAHRKELSRRSRALPMSHLRGQRSPETTSRKAAHRAKERPVRVS